MQINQPVPDFSLPGGNGQLHHLSDYLGKMVIVNFWSAECPWVARADEQILEWSKEWKDEVVYLPVASNANDTQEQVAEVSRQRGLNPVLIDANQQIADLYQAQTTPHIYIVDRQGMLRYRGAFDDVTFRKRIPERLYTREAVLALLAGERPDPADTVPYGCTIVRYNKVG